MPNAKPLALVTTGELKIEKGIPMPGSRDHGLTATLRAMGVGDSFVLKESGRAGVASIAKRVGIKTAIHKISDGQVRVWRIA